MMHLIGDKLNQFDNITWYIYFTLKIIFIEEMPCLTCTCNLYNSYENGEHQ